MTTLVVGHFGPPFSAFITIDPQSQDVLLLCISRYQMVTAYTRFLTLPVTVASNERSLSKLKLLKTYLWAAMPHDRLSDLGILCIEWYRFSEIDKCNVIEIFAQRKACKVNILYSHEEIKVDMFQQANIPIDTCNSWWIILCCMLPCL